MAARSLALVGGLFFVLGLGCEPSSSFNPAQAVQITPIHAAPTEPSAPTPPAQDAAQAPEAPESTEPSTSPQDAPAAPGRLRFGTWNIEWLNSQNGQGKRPRQDADYEALATYAKQLDADVIAVQEIDGIKAIERVFDPALYTYFFEDRSSDQLVGLVVKKGVKVKRYPDLKGLQVKGSSRLRRGVDLLVGQGPDAVRVLAVHLKSGCWSSPLDGPYKPREDARDCATLKAQTPVLKAWADERRAEQKPFIIMGDFNRRMSRGDDVWDALQADPRKPDLQAQTMRTRSKCWSGKYPDFIDHIVLSDRASKLTVQGSFQQVTYSREDERYTLSDHCPISLLTRVR